MPEATAPTGNFQVGDVAGNVTIQQASGDIVTGNKTIINQIIQQVTEEIISAPYKFLAAYDISDRDIFFGRDAIIADLAGKVPRYKVLIINGASGSGKSSLVNAGLIPRLADNGYAYLSFRDYHDPLQQLREYIPEPTETLADKSLLDLIEKCCDAEHERAVIFLDQFERFFVNVPMEKRAEFIQALQHALAQTTADKMNFVIILRYEFFGRLITEFEAVIPEFLSNSTHFNLQPLSLVEAREAIIKPLARLNVKIVYDEQFVDTVLLANLAAQVNTSSGRQEIDPAHLQIVCNALYEAAYTQLTTQQKSAVIIDHALYDALGGAEQILATYLDKTIAVIAPWDKGKAIIRSMLKTMVNSSGTRHFVELETLAEALPDVSTQRIQKLLDKLCEHRVVEERQQRYSLSHEVMVEKVRSWFDEREMRRQQAQETLARGLAEWQASKSPLNQQQLEKIEQWIPNPSPKAAKLIRFSRKIQYRQQQLKRSAKAVGILLVLAIVVLGIYSQLQAQAAREQKVVAETQRLIAEQQKEQARQAEHEALAQRNQALHTQSLFLADLARQQIHQGNATNGLLLALEALPVQAHATATATQVEQSEAEEFARPYVPEAMAQLYNAVVQPRERFILSGPQGKINQLAFDKQGRYLASVSDDGVVRVWTADNGQLIHELGHYDVEVKALAFSADGQWLASGEADGQISIWSVASALLVKRWQAHKAVVDQIAFSQDGSRLVTQATAVHELTIWAVETGDTLLSLSLRNHRAKPVSVSPDAEFVVALANSTAQVRSVAEQRLVFVLRGHQNAINAARWSPAGQWIATAAKDKQVNIWDATTGRLRHTFKHNAPVEQILFSADGQHLLALTKMYRAYYWSIAAGRLVAEWNLATTVQNDEPEAQLPASLMPLHLSEHGRWLISLGDKHRIQIWSTRTGMNLFTLMGHNMNDVVSKAIFNPSATWLASASTDHQIRLWQVYGAQQIRKLAQGSGADYLAWRADSQQLASTGENGIVRIWAVGSGRLLQTLQGHQHNVFKVAFHPHQPQLLSIAEGGAAKLWNLTTSTAQFTLTGHQESLSTGAYSADGRTVVTAARNGTARLWDTVTGDIQHELRGQTRAIRAVAFSPDNRYLATGSDDSSVWLWLVADGIAHAILRGHQDDVRAVQFSPDGQRLATVGKDGIGRLWDVENGQELLVLQVDGGQQRVRQPLLATQFLANGQQLITAGQANQLQLWDSMAGQLLGTLTGYNHPVRHLDARGDLLLAVAEDGTRLWNLAAQPPVRRSLANLGANMDEVVLFAALSPDLQWIALSSSDGIVRLIPLISTTEQIVAHALATRARDLTPQQRKWFFLAAKP